MLPTKKEKLTSKLSVSAMLIAISTVLSLIKLAELPYGGSVTIASMLPIVIAAYRYGSLWGILCGFVHGSLQLVLGLNTLSYVTGWRAVLAVIILDYFIAFALTGAAGFTRRIARNQTGAIISSALIGALFRYACHVLSGATVWVGISIPTAAALKFSFIYNATYMIPETVVLLIVALFISGSLDFSGSRLTATKRTREKNSVYGLVAGAVCTGAAIYVIADVFYSLQNEKTGEFDMRGIANAHWVSIAVVTAIAVASVIISFIMKSRRNKGEKKEQDKSNGCF